MPCFGLVWFGVVWFWLSICAYRRTSLASRARLCLLSNPAFVGPSPPTHPPASADADPNQNPRPPSKSTDPNGGRSIVRGPSRQWPVQAQPPPQKKAGGRRIKGGLVSSFGGRPPGQRRVQHRSRASIPLPGVTAQSPPRPRIVPSWSRRLRSRLEPTFAQDKKKKKAQMDPHVPFRVGGVPPRTASSRRRSLAAGGAPRRRRLAQREAPPSLDDATERPKDWGVSTGFTHTRPKGT